MNQRLEKLKTQREEQIERKRRRQFWFGMNQRPTKTVKRRIDIRPRNRILLNLEGWYECYGSPEFTLPYPFNIKYKEWMETGGRTKFTRWLLRKGETQKTISALGSAFKPISFKLSCRHNDLLRLAESPHYFSCFQNWRGTQQLKYLADPDIGILYVPDKAGHYQWRALVRLMKNTKGELCFLVYRKYGNIWDNAIYERLNKIHTVYRSAKNIGMINRSLQDKIELLRSFTKHNNKEAVGRHVWSDHWCVMNSENFLEMKGVSYDEIIKVQQSSDL